MKKINFTLSILLIFICTTITISCNKDETQTMEEKVEIALAGFAEDLTNNPPSIDDVSERVKQYMLANINDFYGSTVALIDTSGLAIYSPYWFKSNDALDEVNLADTSYHINTQEWLRLPIDTGEAIWTDPYFDEGGGNIWMITRSVPVYIDGKIAAVATTDLEVTPLDD
mgnify:FL=1|tara:strand:+ start:485 stop:994 length:510 start_codon:yes stop_codon:yes gene_type:complete